MTSLCKTGSKQEALNMNLARRVKHDFAAACNVRLNKNSNHVPDRSVVGVLVEIVDTSTEEREISVQFGTLQHTVYLQFALHIADG